MCLRNRVELLLLCVSDISLPQLQHYVEARSAIGRLLPLTSKNFTGSGSHVLPCLFSHFWLRYHAVVAGGNRSHLTKLWPERMVCYTTTTWCYIRQHSIFAEEQYGCRSLLSVTRRGRGRTCLMEKVARPFVRTLSCEEEIARAEDQIQSINTRRTSCSQSTPHFARLLRHTTSCLQCSPIRAPQ